MNNKIIIEANNITCRFGARKVLQNIDWKIVPRENWVVFGLNGSGKTTLLSTIAAYYGISDGTLQIMDKMVTKDNKIDLRKKIGFVSTSFFNRYFKYESVLDIVLSAKFGHFGLENQVSSEDVREVKHILEEWDLKNKYQYPYDLLSQGQQQKVLLVRAIFSKPEILILDEPCSGMDILSKEHFIRCISEKSQNDNVTLIYVSHNPEEFSAIFNRALLIKNGTIHSKGNIRDVFISANISDFLGEPVVVEWFNDRPSIRFIE